MIKLKQYLMMVVNLFKRSENRTVDESEPLKLGVKDYVKLVHPSPRDNLITHRLLNAASRADKLHGSERESITINPFYSHLSLPVAAPPEKLTTLVSAEAMHYFTSISTHPQFGLMMREWLATMHRAKRHIRPEGLPRLLWLGTRSPSLREWILPLLGTRGIWLAKQINKRSWAWVFETPITPIDTLIERERPREEKFIQSLIEDPEPHFIPYFTHAHPIRYIWSERLMRVFLDRVDELRIEAYPGVYSYVYFPSKLMEFCNPFMPYFPLEMRDEIPQRITDSPFLLGSTQGIRTDWHSNLYSIFQFRQNMIDAIKNDSKT